ncbi:hypothetical protein ABHA60_18225, partial [Blautia wexlerae]|uniref:hypothetical protein n=1 Tax=Blautia wexlerae TaxID=418240 RepID=UPI00325A4DB5
DLPIEVREFLLRLLNLYIIFNISKYLAKMKVMALQNHYNMNIIKYKVKYILYLKIFYRE